MNGSWQCRSPVRSSTALAIPMSQPIKMAGGTLTHVYTVPLRPVDESGREGWGEASAAPLMTGETLGSLAGLAASTGYLAQKLVGAKLQQVGEIDALHDGVLYGNASARSCDETALMDLLAKREGLQLHRLLRGGAAGDDSGRFETLHVLASGDLERELEEARSLRAQGYRKWKIKVDASNTANDVRRVRVLSEALAGDVVSGDASQMLTVEEAHAIASAGVESGLSFLEQPDRVDESAAMARLHREHGLAM
jgi:L-alanine-DL-glutamate epimerase-like enolase superfamily enzyme